jgi:trimeric autotransporter adhesin
MKTKILFLIIVVLFSFTTKLYAQIAINPMGASPSSNAILDLNTGTNNNLGLIIPNVTLNASLSTFNPPMANAPNAGDAGMMIYNSVATNQPIGYYYWNGSTWVAVTGGVTGWSLTGNSGTNSSTNFIGTTDAQDLVFKVKNKFSGIIDSEFYTTSLGYKALIVNRGYSNSAFGNLALNSNTSGSGNVAVGVSALQLNVSGQGNTAIGVASLERDTNSYNSGFGSQTLNMNTSGSQNVAVGYEAGFNNSSGNQNTYIQCSSSPNSTGSGNTVVGFGALFNNGSSGDDNTAIGIGAGPYACCSGLSNTTTLGNGAGITGSNSVAIGNTSVTSTWVQVDWTIGSDSRIKKNIQENVPGLAFIKLLRPVTYHYDIDKENELLGAKNTPNWEGKYDIEKIQFTGFIAQEVDAAAKNIGYNFSGVDKRGDMYGLRYAEFVVPLVKAVQEQDDTVETLKAEIVLLKNSNQRQALQIESVQTQITELKELVENALPPTQIKVQPETVGKN